MRDDVFRLRELELLRPLVLRLRAVEARFRVEAVARFRVEAARFRAPVARFRAEVVGYDALVARGSMAACRDHGEVRLEGKEYVVQDGDIINFRFAT